MSHRVFNLQEVAVYLHLTTADVETLIGEREIPCEKFGRRIVFRRQEIDSWASKRILQPHGKQPGGQHPRLFENAKGFSVNKPLMPVLITAKGINPSLSSRTKASVMRDMVTLANQTNLVSDANDLIRTIEEREKMCSTAMYGGLALLHPRKYEPYLFAESFIVLGRTVQAIHFGAPDGNPTRLFFLICCRDDQIHLYTLARLCCMCQKTSLLDELFAADSAKDMHAAILQSEEEIIKGQIRTEKA